MALKVEYHKAGLVPLYLSNKSATVPLAEIQASFVLLSNRFDFKGRSYLYCNLPPHVWKSIKEEAKIPKCPVLWSTEPDTLGRRLVISVDLKTDFFHQALMDTNTLAQSLAIMEATARRKTSNHELKLQN